MGRERERHFFYSAMALDQRDTYEQIRVMGSELPLLTPDELRDLKHHRGTMDCYYNALAQHLNECAKNSFIPSHRVLIAEFGNMRERRRADTAPRVEHPNRLYAFMSGLFTPDGTGGRQSLHEIGQMLYAQTNDIRAQLFLAVIMNQLDEVKAILKAQPSTNLNFKIPPYEESLLDIAFAHRNDELISHLLHKGGNFRQANFMDLRLYFEDQLRRGSHPDLIADLGQQLVKINKNECARYGLLSATYTISQNRSAGCYNLQCLLNKGIHPDFDATETRGSFLFQLASRWIGIDDQALETAELLLKFGADPDWHVSDGSKKKKSILTLAIASGDSRLKRILLDDDRVNVNRADNNGWSALHEAVKRNDIDTIVELLHKGADVNAIGKDDSIAMTPLHLAVRAGCDVEVIDHLIAAGADLSMTNPNNWSVLHEVAQSDNVDVARRLLEAAPDMVNRIGPEGQTPLFIATAFRKPKMTALLLEAGADPNLADDNGQTPLLNAIKLGMLESATQLLEKEANPNLADNQGWTPLHKAVECNYLDTVKTLLDKGADSGAEATQHTNRFFDDDDASEEETEIVTPISLAHKRGGKGDPCYRAICEHERTPQARKWMMM